MDLEATIVETLEGRSSPDNPTHEVAQSNALTISAGKEFESIKVAQSDVPTISIGTEFQSTEEAYEWYLAHAMKMGFSIRKEHLAKTKDGIIRSRRFVCSKEGWRRTDNRVVDRKVYRAETRLGCPAKMSISLFKNGKYRVTHFEATHNHVLETPSKSCVLRSHRKLREAHAAMADIAETFDLRPRETYEFMANQAGGQGCLDYILEDYKNHLRTKRMKQMLEFDAGGLLQYFQKRQCEDSSFFYCIQLDEDQLITNIFWADARMRVDYERFGDVVCFDTTYKTNSYGRPFAPFLGVNHHKQTVFFGAALLYDETASTFQWLFSTFVKAMSGKEPRTILTDQDKAMAIGISSALPHTYHRICVWHMYQNACKQLIHVWNATEAFKDDFGDCVFNHEEEDSFFYAWEKMLEKYELHDNEWLTKLFEERTKWALVYGRNTFTADMVSTQRCESINKVLKQYLDIRQSMFSFFDNFDRLVDDRRWQEVQSDVKMRQTFIRACAPTAILKEAVKLYTPEVYELFEDQYKRGIDLLFQVCDETSVVMSYQVFDDDKHAHEVTLNLEENRVSCSCKKFEFVGILCRHIIRIFIHKQIRSIPLSYVLHRWTKNASDIVVSKCNNSLSSITDEKKLIALRYTTLLSSFVKLATLAATNATVYKFVENACVQTSQEALKLLNNCSLVESMVKAREDAHGVPTAQINQFVAASIDENGVAKGVKRRDEKGKSSLELNSKKRDQKMKPTSTPIQMAAPAPYFVYYPQNLPQLLQGMEVAGSKSLEGNGGSTSDMKDKE